MVLLTRSCAVAVDGVFVIIAILELIGLRVELFFLPVNVTRAFPQLRIGSRVLLNVLMMTTAADQNRLTVRHCVFLAGDGRLRGYRGPPADVGR